LGTAGTVRPNRVAIENGPRASVADLAANAAARWPAMDTETVSPCRRPRRSAPFAQSTPRVHKVDLRSAAMAEPVYGGEELHTYDPGPCPDCGRAQLVHWLKIGEEGERSLWSPRGTTCSNADCTSRAAGGEAALRE